LRVLGELRPHGGELFERGVKRVMFGSCPKSAKMRCQKRSPRDTGGAPGLLRFLVLKERFRLRGLPIIAVALVELVDKSKNDCCCAKPFPAIIQRPNAISFRESVH
jgi:hypothetical protein